ncbi:non-ribosomal peptide synthetase [Paenibacillus assamensis]|uniref:non-ribosomal peptide synthetase n=1 Tax=Paenibacillus assamensis TaxID=311244 RepID=UPI000410C258|nr:non-ribosomal peptide synthetase [Paenibacillus assamensis]
MKDIAIIGMSGRFPDANNLDELVTNLKLGKDSVKKIPDTQIVERTLDPNRKFRSVGYLEDIDKFDHEFFNISMGEAQVMDPYQRLTLESVYNTIENAGYNPKDLSGSRTSVFVADFMPDYYKHADKFVDSLISGNSPAFLSTRITRHFNFTANATMIDTACSSSLVAIHMACNELVLGDADYAIVSAANIYLFPYSDNDFEFNIWSPDNKSRAFSASANGMSCGETIVSVLLKPLDKAMRDRDNIQAVIKGTAVNNNANRSSSPSAPDSISQAEVITMAWDKAGVNPEDIGFIEAHGSGTQLGDSLEVEGLTHAFNKYTNNKNFCPISTIKSNTGHAYAASGLVGMIKGVLSLKHNLLFPTIHFDEPNPLIDFENSAVYVNEKLVDWKAAEGKPRYVGVTSLGASGTNCHILIADAPEVATNNATNQLKTSTKSELFTFSSKTKKGLNRNVSEFLNYISNKEDISLTDVSFTLNKGRDHFGYRYAVIADSVQSLRDALQYDIQNNALDVNNETIKKLIIMFSDCSSIDQGTIAYFRTKYEIFDHYYTECEAISNSKQSNAASFSFQYSMYKWLESKGMYTKHILGIGIGKIISNVILDKLSLTEGLLLAEKYDGEIESDLKTRAKLLFERECKDGRVLFIGMGNGTEFEELLIRESAPYNADFFVIGKSVEDDKDKGLQLLQLLYTSNFYIDWDRYYHKTNARKVELSAYQFERTRCWIRETPNYMYSVIDEQEARSSHVTPKHKFTNTIQQKVYEMWRSVLGVTDITSEDNYFEVGGDSIHATKIILGLNQKFTIKLDFEDIFDFPTISSLSTYIYSLLETKEKLRIIWADVLKNEQINWSDSFFDLGGHSLLANQVLLSIRQDLKVDLNFEDIFGNPTLELLADVVDRKAAQHSLAIENDAIKSVNTQDYYELSSSQKRLWMISQFDGGSTAYNTPFSLLLEGLLDINILTKAIGSVFERHESLRTVFKVVGGNPQQVILNPHTTKLPITVFDYTQIANNIQAAKELLEKDANLQFDLSNGPLLKVMIIKLGLDKHVLYINSHHIINDAWSTHIFYDEIVTVYNALFNGAEYPLEPLTFHYKDYTAWQEQRLKELNQGAYWKEQLGDELPILNMPLDFVRPAIQSHNGDTLEFTFDRELTQGLKVLSQQQKCTLFMVLLAGLNTLLYRYTQQNDIIIGTSVAGRKHRDLENQIGLYINTLALRTRFDSEATIENMLENVREITLQAYENQEYPFDKVIEELDLKRDISRSPIFDVFLELQSSSTLFSKVNFQNTTSIEFDRLNHFSIFDLNIEFKEENDGILYGMLGFNTDLFKKSRMERLIKHYKTIMQQFANHQKQKISDIEILEEQEKHLLMNEWSKGSTFPVEKTFCQLFEEQVSKTPEKIAVACKSEQVTYKELNERSNQIASHLRDLGVQNGSIVAMLTERSIEMATAILGIWKVGAVYLPIDPEYPLGRIIDLLNDSESSCLMLSSESFLQSEEFLSSVTLCKSLKSIIYLGNLQDVITANGLIDLGDIQITDNSSFQLYSTDFTSEVSLDDLSYIIYTSGSTGKPKAAMIEHKGMINHMHVKIKDLEINEESIIAQNANHTFDISIWQFFTALTVGGTTIIYQKNDILAPNKFISNIINDKVTILEVVPSYLSVLLELMEIQSLKLEQLNYLVITGEVVKPSLIKNWFDMTSSVKIVNAYGPTEASDDVTHFIIDKYMDYERVPLGTPVGNMNIYIVDSNMNVCPIGVPGELCVSGIGIGRGYLKDEVRTKQSFVTNPFSNGLDTLYKTGDLACWTENGVIDFFGRLDDQVKIRGFRIEIGEIERSIMAHPNVKNTLVIVKEDDKGSKYLCAFIVVEGQIENSQIEKHVKSMLPDYMVPASYVQLDHFPLTENGKMDKKSLSKMEVIKQNSNFMEPRTEIEKAITNVWEEVLNVKKVGLMDNFFELGGDSIKALRVTVSLQKHSIFVEIKDIFLNQTILALSEYVSDQLPNENSNVEKEMYQSQEINKLNIIKEMDSMKQTLISGSNDNIEDVYPMSDIEIGLLFHTFQNPGSIIHHIQCVYHSQFAEMDMERFNKALELTVKRHQALRCSFNVKDFEKPLKIVHNNIDIDLEYSDISNKTEAQQQEFLLKFMEQDKLHSFDFEKGPIWRMRIFELAEGKLVFLFIFHQAIMDGWSNAMLMSELNEVYIHLENNKEYQPEPLKNTYKEFVIEQQLEKTKDKNIAFWKEELREHKKIDFSEIALADTNVSDRNTYRYRLSESSLEEISAIAKNLESSVKVVCFSVYVRLLQFILGEENIVTSVLTHNRPICEDSDKIIGFFLNMVPVKLGAAEDYSWSEFIQLVDRKLLGLKQFERMPLGEIAHLIGDKNYGENPITDTMFNFTNFNIDNHIEQFVFEETAINKLGVESVIQTNTIFDFNVDVTYGRVDLKIDTSIFNESIVEGFVKYFEDVIQILTEDSSRKLSDVSMDYGLIRAGNRAEEFDFNFNF